MPTQVLGTNRSQRLQKFRNPRKQRRDTTSTVSTTTNLGSMGPRMSEHQCCGVVEEAAFQAREKRAHSTTPQPWISRKLMIFICLGIMAYTGYVYIGRFCISAIKQTPESVVKRPNGIVLLVIFCVLYLWMIWAYIKVVLTPPGYARDHIPQTAQPLMEAPPTPRQDVDLEQTLGQCDQDFDNSKSQWEFDPTRTQRRNKPSYSSTSSHLRRPIPRGPIAGPSYEDIVLRTSLHDQGRSLERPSRAGEGMVVGGASEATQNGDEDGGVGQGRLRTPFDPPFSTFLPEEQLPRHEAAAKEERPDIGGARLGHPRENRTSVEMVTRDAHISHPPAPPIQRAPSKSFHHRSPWKVLGGAMCCVDLNHSKYKNEGLRVRRRPSTTPVLHPAHRYCYRDGLVKPYRTHHCRSCGTCVLKFDHHCPWIGQCVGARNHKFFLNFCQAAGIFTMYVLGTLVGFNVPAWTSQSSLMPLDPQIIVICALAALFALFTNVLASSHVLLILKGQTTVESMTVHNTMELESAALRREYGLFEWCAIQEARRRWNEEWGDLNTEGNLWWTGSKMQGWKDVMGANPLGWILPIGRSLSDGLSYPVNPRFDENGRLRRRVEWPAELR